MPHGGAFVQNLYPIGLEQFDELLRAIAGGFDHFDPAFDDRRHIFRIGRRFDRRQNSQVDAKWLVSQLTGQSDLLRKRLWSRLSQSGEDTQAAGIGNRGGQGRTPYPLHAALDDRITHAQQFGDSGFHDVLQKKAQVSLRSSSPKLRPMISSIISLAPAKIRETRASV
ncbi:hypothetical protein D3C84_723760 [compost metagenome]